MTPVAFITGVGAHTAIGRSAWATAAAARAGLCGFRMHPHMVDPSGEPMRVAQAKWLDLELQGPQRLARLLFPAIDEALQAAPGEAPLPLALGLPPPRPGLAIDLAPQLTRHIEQQYSGRVGPVLTVETGHAAGLLALDLALGNLLKGHWPACIVAGVDSYLAPETLTWIETCDQLHGAGPLTNAWGFIPGEAAAALLLQADGGTDAGRVLGGVVSVGLGHETRLIKTDAVCIGDGLTQAFRAALHALPRDQRIDNVFCDMNGEAYRADEYGFTCLRTSERFREAGDFVAPADCWGDVGAAGAPLHVILALAACRKGYAKGPLSMVWASSEAGQRAAGVVHSPLAIRQ